MRKRSLAVLSLLVLWLLSACAGATVSTPTPAATATPVPESTPVLTPTPAPSLPSDPVAEAIAAMGLEEKVGQLFIAGFEGTTAGAEVSASIRSLHVGGIILYRRNVQSVPQLTELVNALRTLNGDGIPLFLSTDQEGGMVERMPPEISTLPTPYDVAQRGGLPAVAAMGRAIAAQCTAFGLNMNYAPSLDIWSNAENTVIGKRSFGSDRNTVAKLGPVVAYTMMEAGVIPVVKHFPGHGDTATDSHVGLPRVSKTAEELHGEELLPFVRAIGGLSSAAGTPSTPVPAVMVAHILMTELDPEYPATLSKKVVTELLRKELGFTGVILTDDLTMGAITQHYGLGEACVLALEAGCDVLLVCHVQSNVETAYAAVLEAVRSGRLTEARIDESLRRILDLKSAYHLTNAPVPAADAQAVNAMVDQVWAAADDR